MPSNSLKPLWLTGPRQSAQQINLSYLKYRLQTFQFHTFLSPFLPLCLNFGGFCVPRLSFYSNSLPLLKDQEWDFSLAVVFSSEKQRVCRWITQSTEGGKLNQDLPNFKHCDFIVPVLILNDEVVKIVLNSIPFFVFFFPTAERCRDISFCVNIIIIYLQFQNGSVGEHHSSLTPLKPFLLIQNKGHKCQKILLWVCGT